MAIAANSSLPVPAASLTPSTNSSWFSMIKMRFSKTCYFEADILSFRAAESFGVRLRVLPSIPRSLDVDAGATR